MTLSREEMVKEIVESMENWDYMETWDYERVNKLATSYAERNIRKLLNKLSDETLAQLCEVSGD